MQEHITIAGVKIYLGDKLRANKSAQSRGVCKCDEIVEVRTFRIGDRVHIGLYSHQPIKGWGDLDGMVPPRQGLWQESRYLLNFFDLIQQDKVVVKDFNFKKKNLRGMRCKVVYDNYRGQSFVEFDEDIGGGSADGLGKSGYCVGLPSELLENVEESPKNDSIEKKKVVEEIVEEIVEVEKLPYPVDPELWDAIADPETIDPEPIAIKAKMATKQFSRSKEPWDIAVKAGLKAKKCISTPPVTDFDWEISTKNTWNVESNEKEINWKECLFQQPIHVFKSHS